MDNKGVYTKSRKTMAAIFRSVERLHKYLDSKLNGTGYGEPKEGNTLFSSDLLDVVFSPNYGWGVMKLESRHSWRRWVAKGKK